MPSKRDYITEARKLFHDPGVFEIPTDAKVDFETEMVVGKTGNLKENIVGAFIWGRIWMLADDAKGE